MRSRYSHIYTNAIKSLGKAELLRKIDRLSNQAKQYMEEKLIMVKTYLITLQLLAVYLILTQEI